MSILGAISATTNASNPDIQPYVGAGYNFKKNIAGELSYTYVSAFECFNGVNLQVKYNF